MSAEPPKDDEGRLARLDEAAIDAILAMSPEELMEDATTDEVARMRQLIGGAISSAGRERLNRARAAADADAKRPRLVHSAGGFEALRQARARDASFDQKLTLAARGGGVASDADRKGIEEDLEELRRPDKERDGAS